ncbi:hypothetical protein PAECIP111892_03568 [Paenibacillus auburnensis]|uniref:Lipoprotein n=1 Tax=Paenibacillus auburnensis TaxID=2905649 RepID=A0ABN8GKJ3_9BACL|nr:hypothetical protein [Paenibacillus auburnensis]CAH1211429.1 hypothetical protein PAECIP111892_03568 [Paenibacillus auburnensis]
MQRMMLLMLFLGLGLLTGCSQGNDPVTVEARELSTDEVSAYFARQGLELHSVEVRPENVFQRELNGRKPLVFLLDEQELVIYQFATAGEREAGWADFEQHTATADLVPYKAYQEQSLLVFYIHDEGVVGQELYRRVEKVIPGLLELKESGA